MKKLFKYLLTTIFLLLPSAVLAADVEITCYPVAKPSVNMSGGKLFDIQNFIPGQTIVKTLRVVNTDTENACKISFKGEGTKNTLTDMIHIAFSGVYGTIANGEATSTKLLSDFLSKDEDAVQVANLGPGQEVNRNLLLTFNKNADNSLAKKNNSFNIRVISEWGPETAQNNDNPDNGDALGESTSRNRSSRSSAGILGTGGGDMVADAANEEEDVKGADQCEADSKLYGYIFVDRNGNDRKDNREKILPDISLKIYVEDENGEKTTIKELTTNEDGYWEVMLCPGEYFVEVDRNTLPNNTDLADNIKEVVLGESDEQYNLDIGVDDTRNFWEMYWPLILLAVLLLLSALYLILKRRKVFKE